MVFSVYPFISRGTLIPMVKRTYTKMVKTRLPIKLYERVEEFARVNGISVYEALRKLVERGLDRGGLYRFFEDDEFLLSLITIKVKYDGEFARKLARLLADSGRITV